MNESTYLACSLSLEILSVVLAIAGTIFVCIQLWQIRTNRKKQFDQARREKTVEMVTYYSQNTNKETRVIEKIVANFSDEQCQDLYNCTPFSIDEKTKKQICQICPHKQQCENNTTEEVCKLNQDGTFIINDTVLHFIRGNIISYLNTLECVLLAWQLGIVDQNIIEEQFIFLDKKRQKEQALETFRMIAGAGRSYPAIEKFYQHLTQKRNDEAKATLKNILK